MTEEFERLIGECTNAAALDSFLKCHSVLQRNGKAVCSVSGGSDSDIVIDILSRIDTEKQVTYYWYDTGLEYEATKEHLKYLEKRYGITINRMKPKKNIPMCVREFGEPFLSKYVSEQIMRLQAHGFKWEDKPFDVLMQEYEHCKVALQWWCSSYTDKDGNSYPSSRFSIKRNKWLKEFLMAYPPDFPISNKCCYYAKKKVAFEVVKKEKPDLEITGIRKSEGGIRSAVYKTCYTYSEQKGCQSYRPIFWYTNSDKAEYDKQYGVVHSRCYSEYGLKRTGCVGCPYNPKITEELEIIKEHEPKLYKAAVALFGRSYEYTRKYREFQKMMNKKAKECGKVS